MAENTLHLSLKKSDQYGKLPKIVVMGIGGGGCNAVNNMMDKKIEGVEFIAVNTDLQSLANSKAHKVIQLGKTVTKGQGAGSYPEVALAAAEESREEIEEALNEVQLLFLTAGMGGGTGTGATPYIAKIAREKNILTVAVVTKPFQYEAEVRLRLAERGISELRKYVDTMIVLPNENLFRIANKETTLKDAFLSSDNVLYLGVRGITDLITTPGLINLDFADVRMVIKQMGRALMGMGEGEGENRAIKAVEEALSNPLLEDINIKGATGALVNITGSPDMTLFEFDEAAKRIREEIGTDKAIIKVGTAFMKELEGKVRVSIFATGMPESNLYNEQKTLQEQYDEIFEEKDANDSKNSDSNTENNNDKLIVSKSSNTESNNSPKRTSLGKTRISLKEDDNYFNIGIPILEENLDLEIKKNANSLFNIFGMFSQKNDKNDNSSKNSDNHFKTKNREIEFKSNTQSGIDEKTLNVPAYLRKNNNSNKPN